MIMNNHSVNPKAKTMFFIILNRCSKQSDSFVQILLGGKMVPNVVIQNYPHLSKEMKNGHKNELFGKSYLIRNHFWVNFGPKRTKINPIFVRFGPYWMLISMVKMMFVIFLHKNDHRNQMMALSCLKTSFLGSKNQFFNCFEKKVRPRFFFYSFAELQIWQKMIVAQKNPNILGSRPERGPIFDFWGDNRKKLKKLKKLGIFALGDLFGTPTNPFHHSYQILM